MIKDNNLRNKLVTIAFIVHLIVLGLYAVGYHIYYSLLLDFSRTQVINDYFFTIEPQMNSYANLVFYMYLLSILTRLFLTTTFLMWFFRAYKNLIVADPKHMNYSTAWWTVGGFFIPFINFYLPFKLITETWHETQRKAYGYKLVKNNTVVVLWWIFFIVSSIGVSFADMLGNVSPTTIVQIAEIRRNLTILSYSHGGLILSIVFGIIMIRSFAKYERDFKAKLNENSDDLTYNELQID